MISDSDDLSSTFVSGTIRPGVYFSNPSAKGLKEPASDSLYGSGTSASEGTGPSYAPDSPSSPDDGVQKSLQIDMKSLVGDAVGNMSIAPSYRDVVLAARKGLFIIDLEAPLEPPRFVPQGGTWDVADVQWNPHPARAEYIVSTSSEKLLIWNLRLGGNTSIEHVLHSHYRAITDINWHTQDPDIVVSTGIDAWLWAWDLRTPQKPVMGLSAFNAGGTQVKWNRQDGNILASSHMNEALIWDRRKGSIPVKRIKAHTAKIYGIDWAHNSSRELLTCSLDKTIKVWDVHDLPSQTSAVFSDDSTVGFAYSANESTDLPRSVIHTTYPVWRARDLPFGKGILSLPQRGETTLEMWAHGGEEVGLDSKLPIEVFEGHTDVVKEFVWRRGGSDWNDFQLITWSKDKTIRLWPVDRDTMQRAGQPADKPVPPRAQGYAKNEYSFRTPPASIEPTPALSAPVGHRGILAEVRAAPPIRPSSRRRRHRSSNRTKASSFHSHSTPHGSQVSGIATSSSEPESTPTATSRSVPIPISRPAGGTMSRGNIGGKSAKIDALPWLASVKVGDKTVGAGGGGRDGTSSGTGSGQNSGNVSRMGSRSRQSSREPAGGRGLEMSMTSTTGGAPWSVGPEGRDREASGGYARRSGSAGRWDAEEEEQSLQDEITTVLKKLAAHKIKLERADLTKRRTCVIGMWGPWGKNTSVFVRLIFTFPKDYPHAVHPEGTPTAEVERSPLIPVRSRAFMLRRLRAICEQRRPCLEACLRFILFKDADEYDHQHLHLDFDSSSDEDSPSKVRGTNDTTAGDSFGANKNIAEPRTSQGVFGPNGQLVCFSRAPFRIVRNPMHELSVSPSIPQRPVEGLPRLFQSPALLSDAVRRLTVASHDHQVVSPDSHRTGDEGDSILNIMTNLLTFSRLKQRRASEQSRIFDDIPASYSLLPPQVITVHLRNAPPVVGACRDAAHEYIFDGKELLDMCDFNEGVARKYERWDHERFFKMMKIFLPESRQGEVESAPASSSWGSDHLTHHFVTETYKGFAQEKDIQMLAMFSVVLLKLYRSSLSQHEKSPSRRLASPIRLSRNPSSDYFTLRRVTNARLTPVSPGWPRPASSPTINPAPTSFSSLSSRGSWSSLFNTSSMRHFVSRDPETPKENVMQRVPSENEVMAAGIPVPGGGGRRRIIVSGSESPRKKVPDSPQYTNAASPAPVAKSWGDIATRIPLTTATNIQAKAPTFSQIVRAKTVTAQKHLVLHDARSDLDKEKVQALNLFHPQFLQQLVDHVIAYAEMLFRWQLQYKRIELLKSVDEEIKAFLRPMAEPESKEIVVSVICPRCGNDSTPRGKPFCSKCEHRVTKPMCAICHLPVKGLSYSCLLCHHVQHIKCWKAADIPACAAGCGCLCKTTDKEIDKLRATGRYVLSPQSLFVHELPPD